MGKSVNDAIDKSGVTMKYPSVDTAIAMIETFLSSPYMIKIDFKNVFRHCRVHPDNWHLLGYAWRGSYYYHRRLLFGLRSSSWLFNQMADAVEWILHVKFGIRHVIHYLDDFLILASTSKKSKKNIRHHRGDAPASEYRVGTREGGRTNKNFDFFRYKD